MAEDTDNLDEATATTESGPAKAAASEPVLAPKARRAASRATKAGKTAAKKPSSPEERHEARVVERKAKAKARRHERVRSRAKAKASDHQPAVTPPREHVEGIQKTRQGLVVSDKADKTITVRIDVARRHRRYSKVVRTSTRLHAHDETNEAHTGDTVVIQEARPLSRLKRWRLVQVVERAK
jgi:small subunit ribosomal protein S17